MHGANLFITLICCYTSIYI